jgi:hypothetical protein
MMRAGTPVTVAWEGTPFVTTLAALTTTISQLPPIDIEPPPHVRMTDRHDTRDEGSIFTSRPTL